jgi:hypothetical protein
VTCAEEDSAQCAAAVVAEKKRKNIRKTSKRIALCDSKKEERESGKKR